MSIKTRLVKTIAPKVAKNILSKENDMIDVCVKCKGEDRVAIVNCEFWRKKILYKCPKIAIILDDVISSTANDATRPITQAAMSVGEKFEAIKERLKKPFMKKGGETEK